MTLQARLDEMLAAVRDDNVSFGYVFGEAGPRNAANPAVFAALVEVATQADKVCGQNNVNCPGAMRLKRALTALEATLEADHG